MRWLTGFAAGICAASAILAGAYAVNALDDWNAHRLVNLGEIQTIEGDPGYPNRDSNLRSLREQIDAGDREVRKKVVVSALALTVATGAFVPLWRRAARSFGTVRLVALVTVTAAALIGALALAIVILSAGVIRG